MGITPLPSMRSLRKLEPFHSTLLRSSGFKLERSPVKNAVKIRAPFRAQKRRGNHAGEPSPFRRSVREGT